MGLGVFSVFLMAISLRMLLGTTGPSDNPAEPTDRVELMNPINQVNAQPTAEQARLTSTSTETPLPTATLTETSIPLPSPVGLEINSADGAEIVLIPAGEFSMGSDPANDPYFWGAEAPIHLVNLASFWIYRTEVTQGMYQKCAEEKACPVPVKINDPVAQQYGTDRFVNHPVVMVTWQGALAYCQWAGGRLPTEAEWEKAARGKDERLFPWGNDPNAEGLASYSSISPSQVGSYPAGSSPYGVYDMAGNVLEWVNDFFDAGYYQYSPIDNPTGPLSGDRRVIRGGAFNQNGINGLRTVARASLRPTDTKVSVGFRCAINAP
jgi:formylglycine-generating enzyme required for sulfatase activity